MTLQFQAILEHPDHTPAEVAQKRRLLARMLTYLPLLQGVDSGIFHNVCRQHQDFYRDPERLLNELLKVQAQLPAPAPAKPAQPPSSLAKSCAEEITALRRQLSYLTRWDIQLVSGQPSALGIGPFTTKDCGNGYVDLDFFFGSVDDCAA